MKFNNKNMNCPKCKGFMILDEWNGWIWICHHCDYMGRKATDKEIEEYEKRTPGKGI